MKPGHYPVMTNTEYHSGPGISKSHLDKIAISPAHYYAAYLDPNRVPRVATPAMVQGTAIHTAVLEPDCFEVEYLVPPLDMPSKPTSRQRDAKKPSSETLDAIAIWAGFEDAAQGKTVLTSDQWNIALEAQRAVRKNKKAAAILKYGMAEQSYFAIDPETGALVKAKPDWRTPNYAIADVKSTKSASEEGFMRSVMDFRYHLQPGFYFGVIEAALDVTIDEPWWFICVEKEPPYAVAVYTLPPAVQRAGKLEAQRCLQKIVDCKMLDHWPAYSDEIVELPFPRWAMTKMGANSAEADFA